jgi:DNA-binding transcriptional LysR family regulator
MPNAKLPPLKSLVYFEAAARLQSFTRASSELNVTQGAVSRQIRLLEEFLGRKLFEREKRQVFLTDDGHNYYVSIASILQQLKGATDSLLAPADSTQVTLVTSSALAAMYLLPKIPAFRNKNPDIQIRIVARDNINELQNSRFDLALYYCREPVAGYQCTPLFHERVFPVCSPGYLEQNISQFQNSPTFSENLIWMESDEDWINWPEWLDAMGLAVTEFNNKLVVNHYPMVIQAAIAGQGIALAWAHLVDIELENGFLVVPTDQYLETGSRFFLITPGTPKPNPRVTTLNNWLVDHHEC